jgi:DNA-binding NarL/FixJ family response regulator
MSQAAGAQADGAHGTVRVFLLDDHEVVRRGLHDLLDAEADIEVVGDAGTAESAMNRMLVLQPDVALLDVRLPDGDGVTVCREIRSALPGTACLMLTGYGDDQALLGAIMAGAAGYVMKQASSAELLGAVRAVAAGRSTLDADAARRVMRRLREGSATEQSVATLSAQEKRVLDLIGDGLTNRQISERMYLSEKTAKNYVSAVLSKLGMQRRSQAAALAARLASPAELSADYGVYITPTFSFRLSATRFSSIQRLD